MSDGDEVNEVNKVNVEEGSTSEPSVEVSEEAPKDEEVSEEAPKEEEVVSEEAPKEEEEVVSEEAPKEEEEVVSEEAPKEEEVVSEEAPKEEEVVSEEAPKEEEVVSEEAPKDEEKLLALREGANEVINISRTCSLKTLVKVLGKWSCGEFKKIEFIHLLKEGSDVDENLDDFEKVVDIIQLWLKTGSDFKNNNYFLKLDEYTFVKESRNLDPEKKKQLLKELIEFLIYCSRGLYNNEQIQNFLDDLY